MPRPRVRVIDGPRRLILTDTPRPDCPDCEGGGGLEYMIRDSTGDYAGTDVEPCPCHNGRGPWTLLRLPPRHLIRRIVRRGPWATGSNDDGEPPF